MDSKEELHENYTNFIKILAERVFNNLGSGHNEKIYHKALKTELECQGILSDTERHVAVIYIDSKGVNHCLESERIDLFIHSNPDNWSDIKNVVCELKAISKNIGEPERIQVKKYFKELKKQNISCDLGIIINFPQPSSKDTREIIDFETLLP